MGEEGSVYAMMASWITPSCLFIFVNLVIGTIAITSRFANPRQRKLDSPAQLVRSPSLLERVASFGLGHQEPSTLVETQPAIEPPRLDRAPSSSLLDRVRSFNLGLCKVEKQEGPGPNPDDPTPNELARAPSLLERLMSVKFHRSEEKEPGSEPGPGGDLVEGEEELGVDAKADDFIKRFKQQLRLQRLDSILRYRDMLKRH
ncbi:hypothetical protein SESBI_02083 [Sesbania bispinosa]|nr:hypothetical protein SESBI_02083 [Sesbania bispinosa]